MSSEDVSMEFVEWFSYVGSCSWFSQQEFDKFEHVGISDSLEVGYKMLHMEENTEKALTISPSDNIHRHRKSESHQLQASL